MRKYNKSIAMGAMLLGLILTTGLISSCLVQQIGGAFSEEPEALKDNLSEGAQQLIQAAFEGIPPENMVDYHVHLLGLGTHGTGAFINPKMQSWWHPFQRFKFDVYISAIGVEDLNNADQEYVTRLVRLIENMDKHGKYHLLAFDKFYELDGKANLENTQFYVPNDYVVQVAQQYPKLFEPTISVHPYRKDAIPELEKWAKQGVRFVKWLPNAMGIDPSHESLNGFYQTMKEHQMVLLSHTGKEQAVESATPQLGNPLLLQKPLNMGVRVIMAHSASLGNCLDLQSPSQPSVPCFDLFLRMMGEKQYEGKLFGEISAISQVNRPLEYLTTLIKRQDLHSRLVNGSDYPIPAVNFIIHTKRFVRKGFLSKHEGQFLNEIYQYNPLLYDFVLKRTLRVPKTELRFSSSIFLKKSELD